MELASLLLEQGQKLHQQQPSIESILSVQSAGCWWQAQVPKLDAQLPLTDKAALLAFQANHFASAFNVAYQFALRYLFADVLGGSDLACLCVSEKGGNSPKNIETYIREEQGALLLNGLKTFVTCAPQVDSLLLLVDDQRTVGSEKKQLRILLLKDFQSLLAENRQGLELVISMPSKFLPEIEKGSLYFNDFKLTDAHILPLEAHAHYSKPFSVLEGLFIRLANVSYLLKWSFYFDWPKGIKADLLAQLLLLKRLIDTTPLAAKTQIVLDAQARQLEHLLPEIESLLPTCPSVFQQLWQRDKLVFFMDAHLRKQRLENAWRQFG